MPITVQARLDEETQASLELLRRRGLSTSEVLRKGISLVAREYAAPKRRRLIGMGEYDSGVSDLATNKKHVEGFGSKSMGEGWRPPKDRTK